MLQVLIPYVVDVSDSVVMSEADKKFGYAMLIILVFIWGITWIIEGFKYLSFLKNKKYQIYKQSFYINRPNFFDLIMLFIFALILFVYLSAFLAKYL